MAILVTPQTRVLVQGITGSFGARHTQLSLDYGTQIVAGVTPGKGGQRFEGQVPIFDTVSEAMKQTGATASAIFVPPAFAADAILEGAAAGLDLVVCITEGIPIRDMIRYGSLYLAASREPNVWRAMCAVQGLFTFARYANSFKYRLNF